MPFITLKNINTYYLEKGKGQAIICLLGWGQDTRMFEPTCEHLSVSFNVFVIDFPGFGKSELMESSWGVDDYVEFLDAFVQQKNLSNPILIAHSFGARVALKYAINHPVRKMILTGAAGLKPKHGLGYYTKVYTYKAAKQVFKLPVLKNYKETVLSHFGSSDYKAIKGVLKESFVKIVNEDLRELLPKISVSTLLIWGENDDATPLWMGKVMEKQMQDAGLVIFEKDGHYAYWNQIDRFHNIVDVFIKEDAHG